jgi:hypothetical protein
MTLPMTSGFVGVHAVRVNGTVQQYTLPSANYADYDASAAFPTENLGADFVGCFPRCATADHDAKMQDDTNRDALLYLFKVDLDPGESTLQETRRNIGEFVAARLTLHANHVGLLPNGMRYDYTKTFRYVSDDPHYGTEDQPMANHLQNQTAIRLFQQQYDDITLQEMATDDETLNDIFGAATDDTRRLVLGDEWVLP